MKILSPAGNKESFYAAIANGADEVYLGISQFNARNNIIGFSADDLCELVDYAHLARVKVLLAVNILFKDAEIIDAVNLVVNAYNLGVDAFIVQDLGLAELIHKQYPQIELHASTQMGIHNLEGVQAIEKYGFKRVVLSRETPLAEIKRIKKASNIEIEYFCHGALCVSFSGNCYLSSYLNDASGNRGKCKQLCRLPYTFEERGREVKKGYLLSAKDFDMTARLKNLEEAGVDVIKIEGRARRPYYVATATRAYYRALRGLKFDKDELKLAFNRGYTEGYFNGNGNIISGVQSHVGIPIGTVSMVKSGKRFNEVYFSSTRQLFPKSTFKVFKNGVEKTTLTAFDLQKIDLKRYRITTTQKLSVGDELRLITDANLEEQIIYLPPKCTVKLSVCAQHNQPIKAVAEIDGGTAITVEGEVLQTAKTQPLTREQVSDNFLKTDNFFFEITFDKFDKVFIPKKALNSFRRSVIEACVKTIVAPYKRNLQNIAKFPRVEFEQFTDFEIIEHLTAVPNAKNIIYSPQEYTVDDVKAFQLKCQKIGKTPILDTPNFALQKDVQLLKEIIDKTGITIVANNYYALTLAKECSIPVIIGGGLNVYNRYIANAINAPFIAAEGEWDNVVKFPYMTLRHCPLKSHLNADCNSCPYHNDFTYKMDSGKRLKLKRKKMSTCTFYLSD